MAQSGEVSKQGLATRGPPRGDGRAEVVCGGLGRRRQTARPTFGSGRHCDSAVTKANGSAAAGASVCVGLAGKRLVALPRCVGRPNGLPKQGRGDGAPHPSGSSSLAGRGLRGGRHLRKEGYGGSDSMASSEVAALNSFNGFPTTEVRRGQASSASAGRVSGAASPKIPTRSTLLPSAVAVGFRGLSAMSQGRESPVGRLVETNARGGTVSGVARKTASHSLFGGKVRGRGAMVRY